MRCATALVILTADHGEHLGEDHRLDHQYSLHDALLRVPLVVRHPAHFAPGRDARPVMNFDLHPTVLEIAGLPSGVTGAYSAQSLLRPLAARDRLSEEPALPDIGMADVRAAHPDWDPAPFRQRLRAWTDRTGWKYIWRSNAPSSLFDLNSDPREERDRIDAEEPRALALSAALSAYRHTRALCEPAAAAARRIRPRSLSRRLMITATNEAVPEALRRPGERRAVRREDLVSEDGRPAAMSPETRGHDPQVRPSLTFAF